MIKQLFALSQIYENNQAIYLSCLVEREKLYPPQSNNLTANIHQKIGWLFMKVKTLF